MRTIIVVIVGDTAVVAIATFGVRDSVGMQSKVKAWNCMVF